MADLREFSTINYFEAKGDLATTFLDRMLKISTVNGRIACVMPLPWLFLGTYKKFRVTILKNRRIDFIARLGAGAFCQISGEVVKAILVSISVKTPNQTNCLIGLDVFNIKGSIAKDFNLKTATCI